MNKDKKYKFGEKIISIICEATIIVKKLNLNDF